MDSNRRILCLWFPRLAAERLIRRMGGDGGEPVVVLRDTGNMQVIYSLNAVAEAQGLRQGQPRRDAMAMCPNMVTRLANLQNEASFLRKLRRWAGKYSPWIAEEGVAGLVLDVTGCTHLFDGEAEMIEQIERECAGFGLTVCAGLADTMGAAWGLARFAGQQAGSLRSGDAIDQEAHATRSRAAKRRHWERGGTAPKLETPEVRQSRIARHGRTRQAIGKLPMAALRLTNEDVTALAKLGLRRVDDILGMPRAALARRFGRSVVRRLDQALGIEPEPVSAAKPEVHFSVRLTLPDPIGLEADILAAIDRLLPPLCEKLKSKGQGVRKLRLQAFRTDETSQCIDVGLARPGYDPGRIAPLLGMKLCDLDVGFGVDIIRLEVLSHEPVQIKQHSGHAEAQTRAVADTNGLEDLVGRLGARIGLEEIVWMHPASSHIPEKAMMMMAAAWAEPVLEWPKASVQRPLTMFPPEPVMAEDVPMPPSQFRWRGRNLTRGLAVGPERISPEWWLDEPAWRTGVRDYWRVDVAGGERLLMYYAHGAAKNGG
jgi:protein ImuB